jgi:transketolase
VRELRGEVVIAVGPMLDNVLAATEGLDVTVLYATSVRPFDDAAVRRAAGDRPDVVIVEPYLAGTSTAAANDAGGHPAPGARPGRWPRWTATVRPIDEHLAGHGLDPKSLHERIAGFLSHSGR